MAKCHGKNSRGDPCRMAAIKGTRWCWNHSPEKVTARAKSRKAGGEKRHSPHGGELDSIAKNPRTIPDVFSILDYALAEVLSLDNGIQRAHVLVAIVKTFAEMIKVSDFEQRISALEAKRK